MYLSLSGISQKRGMKYISFHCILHSIKPCFVGSTNINMFNQTVNQSSLNKVYKIGKSIVIILIVLIIKIDIPFNGHILRSYNQIPAMLVVNGGHVQQCTWSHTNANTNHAMVTPFMHILRQCSSVLTAFLQLSHDLPDQE